MVPRLGKVTASRIADIVATTKSGYSTSRGKYLMQLLCERMTGIRDEGRTSEAMKRGNDLEDKASAVYMLETGEIVEKIGFVPHPKIENSGASPDGLIGNDGLIEIKCPNTATHIEFLRTREPQDKYIKQMQWQMACTGRQWCDFVSYDDRLPENLALAVVRIKRDEALITKLECEVTKFLDEVDRKINELKYTVS